MNRWLKRTAVGILVALAFSIAGTVWTRRSDRAVGEERLALLEAELDSTDPGWRLEQLLASRDAARPPDDRNLTKLCWEVRERRPKAFEKWQADSGKWLPTPDLNRLPDPDKLAAARQALAEADEALQLARMARTRPTGGWPLEVKPNPLSTLLPHLDRVRDVAGLLDTDAVLAAVDGNAAQALASAAAALHLSRAVGDEPLAISQLVRTATDQIAVGILERSLALSELPPTGLTEVQTALLAEATEQRLVASLRGERAFMQRLMANLDSGVLTLRQMAGGAAEWDDGLSFWLMQRHIPNDRAYHLDYLTQLLAIAGHPAHEQSELFDQMEIPEPGPGRNLTRLLLPAYQKLAAAEWRLLARLHSAAIGLACERFRQANGRWPADLAELKDLLPTVPLDPYDGQPLRYRRLDDGVVVYSVGPDRQDDGGNLSYGNPQPGEDVGFRLWDVAARRQPAQP